MRTFRVVGHSRTRIFFILAAIWIGMVGALLLSNFQSQYGSTIQQLEFKAEAQSVQFERHWASLSVSSRQAKREYLVLLNQGFKPSLSLSLIDLNGKVKASTRSDLTQASYSPVISQLKKIAGAEHGCTEQLYNFMASPVIACAYFHEASQSYLVTSMDNQDLFMHWLTLSGHFIVAVTSGLLIFSLLFYFLSVHQQNTRSRQKDLDEKFQRQGDSFKRLISNLPGLVYRLRIRDQQLDFVSSGSMQLLGYPPEHFFNNGITPFDLIDDDDKHNFTRQTHKAHFSLKPFELVYRMKTLQEDIKWVLDRGRCYTDKDGEHYVEGVILDITEREMVRQQIEFLAIQDPLTELFNRYKFNDQLVGAVDQAIRKNERFAMLFIDLDRFKNINDSLGHQLGDRLLRKVASRLQSLLPKQHFLARMGGDEFVVLMHPVESEESVSALASHINRALRKPFNIDSYQLRTSCSIGISLCPDHSDHSHILWRYADTAMYQVKNRGGDGYQFFTNEMGDLVQHRITIEHSFIPALENNEFTLAYQPQVNIESGEIIGAEALIRWHHPKLGFVSPAEFIPIAEETGFIHELGDWILNQALAQLSHWQRVKPNFSMAVNVSALQITEEFPKRLEGILHHHEIQPDALELEITESLLMENLDFVQPLLNEMKQQDVRFAIDDFGTGYSSLSYLRYLPINKLKIDRSFVMNLESSNDDVALVKAMIAMAKNLNLTVLAEGIETAGQLEILGSHGCDSYQGYYFSKPIDAETFNSLYIGEGVDVQSRA